jgi:hypothetical protein
VNRSNAKKITLVILDRWEHLANREQGRGIRFVVIKHRTVVPGNQETGYIFHSRYAAMNFGQNSYGDDFALLAMTPTGTVNITPGRS